jgi:hypothetical protein
MDLHLDLVQCINNDEFRLKSDSVFSHFSFVVVVTLAGTPGYLFP